MKSLILLTSNLILSFLIACQPQTPTATPTPKLGIDIPVRIMPLGDSITEGVCDTPANCHMPEIKAPLENSDVDTCNWSLNNFNPKAVGYRLFLRDKLLAQGLQVNFVGSVSVVEGLLHEGHSGWTIDDFDFCIQNANWLQTARPDIILLHVGTTDALVAHTPDEMATKLTTLLDHIYDVLPQTTEVIVAQIITTRQDVTSDSTGSTVFTRDIIASFNAKIPEVVDKFIVDGRHVSYVDLSTVIESDSDFDALGLHPIPTAAERMADIWLDGVLEVLGQQR